MSKVDEQANGCWRWTSTVKTGGYPYFTFGWQAFRAHRLSYLWAHPGITFEDMDGLEIDHLCRNRLCVNPEHLELVTPRENTMRGDTAARRNAEKTHCIHGHPFDEKNTGRQWNKRDKAMMRYCRECRRLGVLRRKGRIVG